MFSRTKATTAPPQAPSPLQSTRPEPVKAAPPSIISADLKIVGDLTSKGEIQIDGTIEGDIRCQVLIIGQSGIVTGEIIADTVRVHGTLTGQIRARSVFLAATARVVGDISHESLAIEPGAFLEGHCGRIDPKKEGKSTTTLTLADPPATASLPAPETPSKADFKKAGNG
jgi:filamentous hemagglutinin family protein